MRPREPAPRPAARSRAKASGSRSKARRRRTISARTRGLGRADHLDAETEAVEQLRAQLALLDVHRADEQEARVVHGRDSVALDARDARGRRVEQRVDEVVGQQVDLVDVEDAPVGAGEQAGLEGLLAVQRAAEVERADEPVEARAERQLDERRRSQLDLGVGGHEPARAPARRARTRTPARWRPAPAAAAARARAPRSTWPCRARRAPARRRPRARPR